MKVNFDGLRLNLIDNLNDLRSALVDFGSIESKVMFDKVAEDANMLNFLFDDSDETFNRLDQKVDYFFTECEED